MDIADEYLFIIIILVISVPDMGFFHRRERVKKEFPMGRKERLSVIRFFSGISHNGSPSLTQMSQKGKRGVRPLFKINPISYVRRFEDSGIECCKKLKLFGVFILQVY